LSTKLTFEITPQPDDTACGPSCLHAVYRYYEDDIPAEQVIREVQQLEGGGTLAVYLALHALRRKYEATIYTCDLQMFDPSWFDTEAPLIGPRLAAQMKIKRQAKFQAATRAYLEFLDHGGDLFMEDITISMLGAILTTGAPIITGLSATWLYRSPRERTTDLEPDDIVGEPLGHFVVIHGIDEARHVAWVADPYIHKPFSASHVYEVDANRLIGAIYLGIITYDAKLLIIRPKGRE